MPYLARISAIRGWKLRSFTVIGRSTKYRKLAVDGVDSLGGTQLIADDSLLLFAADQRAHMVESEVVFGDRLDQPFPLFGQFQNLVVHQTLDLVARPLQPSSRSNRWTIRSESPRRVPKRRDLSSNPRHFVSGDAAFLSARILAG